MRRFGILSSSIALVALSLAGLAHAQRSDTEDARRSQDGSQRTQPAQANQRRDTLRDDEVRLRYDDERDRLQLDVEEDVQFRDDQRSGRDRGWARQGEFDFRYDTDKSDLRLQGEGTIDVDKVGSAVAHWWQTWWDRERQQRHSAQQGAESGARTFIKQYDDNEDNFVSKSELPSVMRDRFEEIDRNGDDHLSYREIRSVGAGIYNDRDRGSARRTSDVDYDQNNRYASNREDQSWSQWWSSWWSDEDQSREGSQSGAQRLLRLYDKNDSGNLSRTELPSRMRDDFDRVDRNNDNYLSSSELRQHGDMLRDQRRTVGRVSTDRGDRSQDDQTWNQWWNSWFEDNPRDEPRNLITTGAREFIRRHDQNDDGYLVRSELPDRMYDDFSRIDRNDDRYLTRSEIERFAEQNDYRQPRRFDDQSTSASRSRQPVQAVAYWIIDVDEGQLQVDDVQQAYDRLRKIDADNDGEITRDELREHRNQGQRR